MYSQIDRNLFQTQCSRRDARQRRGRLVITALVGGLFSLGVLSTLQAASEGGGDLPVMQTVHGSGGRLLSGGGNVELAPDSLSYAVLANMPRVAATKPKAIELSATESAGKPSGATGAGVVAPEDAALARAEAALAALDQWAAAWRSKDVDGYLAAYGDGFTPANGVTRDEWAKLRRQRISDKREIRLELHDVAVETEAADRVRVSFVQDYRADRFVERGITKSMVLALEKGGWRILAEETLR